MHEMGIAVEIHRSCREAVAAHGTGRIETIRMAIGELAAVEPDLIEFAWQAATADGPDAGSELEIRWCPADQYCPSCAASKRRSEGAWLRLCPDCGAALEIRGGDELDILDITYITED